MTLDELVALEADYQDAAANAEGLRRRRNEAIRQLASEGVRVSHIARALGLTRSRVDQVVRGG